MSTCIRCQTKAVAALAGTEADLIDELYRQIDRLINRDLTTAPLPCVEVIDRAEHERIVETLNRTIVDRNAEIDRLRKQGRR